VSVIVIQFVTLDGVIEDPDGRAGTPVGGWAFRHGPQAVVGDSFRLGPVLDNGVLLLGRATWEHFSRLWPHRDDPFSARMNAVPKLVASGKATDVSAWQNSRVVHDAAQAVQEEDRDVTVMGSWSIVQTLRSADLIDEFRLITFPTVAGSGRRLFPEGGSPLDLECVEVQPRETSMFTRYVRAR
jgi:dihydrofolate reductase